MIRTTSVVLCLLLGLAGCAGPAGQESGLDPGAAAPGSVPSTQPGGKREDLLKQAEDLRHTPLDDEAVYSRAQAILMGKVMEHVRQMESLGRFHIKGDVVDDQGNPLTDIAMTVTKCQPDRWGGGMGMIYGARENTKSTIDGKFDVRASGCATLGLKFEKPGYYKASISLDTNPRMSELDTLLHGGQVLPSPVVKDGIRIVLEKQGKVVSLISRRELSYYSDGRGTVIDLTRYGRDDLTRKSILPEIISSNEVRTFREPSRVPPNCLAAIVDIDPAANRFIPRTSVAAGGTSVRPDLPARVRLVLNAPNGGLQWYISKNPPKNPMRPMWNMKQAPVDGYVQTLEITEETINQMAKQGHKGCLLFYFKTAEGCYGKGKFCVAEIWQEKTGRQWILFQSTGVWINFDPGERSLEDPGAF